jgi:hypothetical protein
MIFEIDIARIQMGSKVKDGMRVSLIDSSAPSVDKIRDDNCRSRDLQPQFFLPYLLDPSLAPIFYRILK